MTHTHHRLEVEKASIGYGEKIVMRDLSFQVPHGARVAVVGPNGAGKSTLFKALVGILPLQSGRILIHGELLGGGLAFPSHCQRRGDDGALWSNGMVEPPIKNRQTDRPQKY